MTDVQRTATSDSGFDELMWEFRRIRFLLVLLIALVLVLLVSAW